MTRLAYLGPPGTFTEEAALTYRAEAEFMHFPTEAAVASAVESAMADEGVLPIENSLEGSVTGTLDVLIHDSKLAIRAELILPVEQCLIGRPGMQADDVKVIYSKPQALGQCRKFIESRFPEIHQEAALSTTAAVQQIMNVAGGAAIGAARAAELYGAEVLVRGVQDTPDNKTRFAVLGREDAEPTGRDKTSVAFSVPHDRPGTLVEVLHEFADRSINLTKIESRPSREGLGTYIFLVDMEGHRSEANVAEALSSVETTALFLRVLGSYPRWHDARNPRS